MLSTAFICILAYLFDAFVGEPRRYHPLAGFGAWANTTAERLHPGEHASPAVSFALGGLCWLVVVSVPMMLVGIMFTLTGGWLELLFSLIVLYLCIAPRSLVEHAEAVARALKAGDLPAARKACSKIVSRDTHTMSASEISSATVESVLENAHDGVVAPFVWFACFGWWGALLFRLSNTLDAMWGYRNARYNYFGRWAARCDDVLGFITSRVTVLLYALRGKRALSAALEQEDRWESPNAGPVMAAGAAILNVRLGGPVSYGGQRKERPFLGIGQAPQAEDIARALKLVRDAYRALLMFILAVALVTAI